MFKLLSSIVLTFDIFYPTKLSVKCGLYAISAVFESLFSTLLHSLFFTFFTLSCGYFVILCYNILKYMQIILKKL